jgi:type I restriction enzyme S subunit
MNNSWPKVKLGEVINHRKDFVRIDDLSTYKRCRVQLHVKGIVLRDLVAGSELKTKEQQICRSGDFLVAEIDAKVGGYGIVPDELAGAIVSSHYFLFDVDRTRLDRNFLGYFIKTPDFFDQVSARGTTNYAAIRPSHVLEYQTPLPPLTEQQRIVTKIEKMVTKIEEAHRLCHETTQELPALFASASRVAFKPKPHWSEARVGDFCEMPQYGYTESATTEPVGPRFLRITDIQNGRVNWDNVPYCSCPNPRPYFLKENDILFARTGATTGKSFLIRDCPEAVFASYLIRLRVRSTVTPEYLYQYFQSPSYWIPVIEEKNGTGQPNVNGKKLANIRVPIPPLEEQRRIVEYLGGLTDKLEVLSGLQVNTTSELEALLPSILDKAFKGEL